MNNMQSSKREMLALQDLTQVHMTVDVVIVNFAPASFDEQP